jgi:hypothetical protein
MTEAALAKAAPRRQPTTASRQSYRQSAPLDEIAHHVDGTFVLVVKVTGGKYRRRCFLSAASAEKAARNALEAGHNATVYLAELKPLWKLAGGDRR